MRSSDEQTGSDHEQLGFDPDALRARYREERDKRFRRQRPPTYKTKMSQSEVADPYVAVNDPREPVRREVEVVVVGGGFAGQLTSVELGKRGISDFLIIEQAADFGGTWYWNRYPGAQCDIESYIYMPLLEETGYMPTQRYANCTEIFEHAQRIGRTFDLYRRALFQTEVSGMRWDAEARRWLVTTDRDDVLMARYVVTASGPLNRKKFPDIPGLETFRGHIFHTSRWDYDYTGGGPDGDLSGLRDKSVAVIGTGATGIQVVPFVARDARHLYVVQRTPSTVDVRGNRPTDPEWVRSLKPGWQKARMENFNTIVSGGHVDVDLIQDGWTDVFGSVMAAMPENAAELSPEEIGRYRELADFRKGHQVRQRVDSIVRDAKVADALKAWYPMFCKRPGFSDLYLDAFNRDNVTLVDTDGQDIDRISENGIVVANVEYPVDCIIFATGFETTAGYVRRLGFEVYGRDGETLSSHFANGLRTLHGFYADGFPNFFIQGISQNAFKPNNVDMLGEQAMHIARMIAHTKESGYLTIEPTPAAVQQWVDVIREKAELTRAFLAECTPGYFSGEGDIDKGLLVETYQGGALEFSQLLSDWFASGDMAGLAFD